MSTDLTTAAGLTAAAGFILSLLFILIPPLRKWFTDQDAETQTALTGGLILLIAIIVVFGSCYGLFTLITCEQRSIVEYLVMTAFAAVLGIGVNRATFAAERYRVRGQPEAMQGRATGKLLNW